VSLSPSTTETLFALGLGDRVVGVTRFCQYPPEAQTRTKVGGYLDPSYEAIVALEPDLVVLRGEKAEYVDGFKALGLEVLAVRHQSVDDILAAIRTIGRACGAQDRADRLAADLEDRMQQLRQRTAGLERPRVLLVIERTLGTGKIQDVYVAGGDGFLHATIELAGGQNACPKTSVGAPVVSADGIVQMNPEVIVELMSKERLAGRSEQEVLADWQPLSDLAAVRAGRVYLVADEGILVPGPRFLRLAERLARLIHPEVAW
jgi:iron complex transport system substrate-binding protein